jgi:hypothetical protein
LGWLRRGSENGVLLEGSEQEALLNQILDRRVCSNDFHDEQQAQNNTLRLETVRIYHKGRAATIISPVRNENLFG